MTDKEELINCGRCTVQKIGRISLQKVCTELGIKEGEVLEVYIKRVNAPLPEIELLEKSGFHDITVCNTRISASISCTSPLGEYIGIVLKPEMCNLEDLKTMKSKYSRMYNRVIFLCDFRYYSEIRNVLGDEYCIPKGKEFEKFVKSKELE